MKLIIDISESDMEIINKHNFEWNYCVDNLFNVIKNGIPLDDVKAEISEKICLTDNPYTKETKYTIEHLKLLEILDNISKSESEVRNGTTNKK